MATQTIKMDGANVAYLSVLYEEIRAMDPADMIRLTWGGNVVARIIVGA